MSRLLDSRMEWIHELLDMLDGSDHLSRLESGAAPAGFAEPVVRWGTCGWCKGKGCRFCKHGRVSYRERDGYDKTPNVFGGPMELVEDVVVVMDERDLQKIASLRLELSDKVFMVSTAETIELPERDKRTKVERSALRQLPHSDGLHWLAGRLETAPDWVVNDPRERDAIEWLARRSLEDNIRAPRLLN